MKDGPQYKGVQTVKVRPVEETRTIASSYRTQPVAQAGTEEADRDNVMYPRRTVGYVAGSKRGMTSLANSSMERMTWA